MRRVLLFVGAASLLIAPIAGLDIMFVAGAGIMGTDSQRMEGRYA